MNTPPASDKRCRPAFWTPFSCAGYIGPSLRTYQGSFHRQSARCGSPGDAQLRSRIWVVPSGPTAGVQPEGARIEGSAAEDHSVTKAPRDRARLCAHCRSSSSPSQDLRSASRPHQHSHPVRPFSLRGARAGSGSGLIGNPGPGSWFACRDCGTALAITARGFDRRAQDDATDSLGTESVLGTASWERAAKRHRISIRAPRVNS
jgi:hypothetical protein